MHKGYKLSAETKNNISKNNAKHWKGKQRSDETKEKISKSLKGKYAGTKGWNYKKGLPKCTDCGKQLNRYASITCRPCANKRKSGKNSHAWTGGTYKHNGYVYIYSPKHPSNKSRKYVKRARLIMEKHLGRYLINEELVHHINGNKSDDRIKNLELLESNSAHRRHHGKLKSNLQEYSLKQKLLRNSPK